MRFLFAFIVALMASPAAAQTSFPCDWEAHVDNIAEPWEDNIATFSNGAIRVALLDTIEPASASAYLLILHPPTNEMGVRVCTSVGLDDGLGYAAMFFEDLTSSYSPETGLVLTIPAIIFLPEQSFQNSALVKITINQASGEVSVSQNLGNE